MRSFFLFRPGISKCITFSLVGSVSGSIGVGGDIFLVRWSFSPPEELQHSAWKVKGTKTFQKLYIHTKTAKSLTPSSIKVTSPLIRDNFELVEASFSTLLVRKDPLFVRDLNFLASTFPSLDALVGLPRQNRQQEN